MRSSIVIDMAKKSRRNKKEDESMRIKVKNYKVAKLIAGLFDGFHIDRKGNNVFLVINKKNQTYEYPEDDPIYKYLEAFGKKPENLDEAYEKLAGHEELEIPAPDLDLALERLAKRHKYKNPQLDEAYKYLAGQVHS